MNHRSCANCNEMPAQSSKNLICPTCKDLGIIGHDSYFCSKACFKLAWKSHKALHKATPEPVKGSFKDLEEKVGIGFDAYQEKSEKETITEFYTFATFLAETKAICKTWEDRVKKDGGFIVTDNTTPSNVKKVHPHDALLILDKRNMFLIKSLRSKLAKWETDIVDTEILSAQRREDELSAETGIDLDATPVEDEMTRRKLKLRTPWNVSPSTSKLSKTQNLFVMDNLRMFKDLYCDYKCGGPMKKY